MTDALLKTPLHAAHVAAGAKMVDFGGWHMPVQYAGILAEHKAVREEAGAFDVSHMGQVDFRGANALKAIQLLITNDASKLVDGQALYTAVCYPDGGIVDDCIVYKHTDDFYRIVVNASNIEKDFNFFKEHAGDICDITNHSDEWALIAVQGPKAREIVSKLGEDSWMDMKPFFHGKGQLAGINVELARTGYTGEDGFEIFVPIADGIKAWDAIIEAGVSPIGLGARDTLRLEARLCLYGNDITKDTTPLEAGLGWVVKPAKGDFIGAKAIAAQKAEGFTKKLIGFKIVGRGIARPGTDVVDADGNKIGTVTSGAPAPTVGGAVGMAYVPKAIATPGEKLTLSQRGRTLEAEIVKGPFYRRG